MELLIRERAAIKSKLTLAMKFLADRNKTEMATLSESNSRLEKVKECYYDFDKIQTKIQTICKEEEIEIQASVREEFEDKYFSIKSKLDDLISSKICEIPVQNNSLQTSHSISQVKLPRLDLPSFSGNYVDWISFHDLFKVLVHENNTLGNVQKLQYLKSCLHGDASRLIQSIQITDANYDEAWKLLTERYDNKRLIIGAHYKSLLRQKALQKDSARGLRQLLDVYLENMRSLSVLKADDWDSIMVHLFTERLDDETRKLWEMTIANTQQPSFNELKTFVQQRCQALETTEFTSERGKQTQSNRLVTNTISKSTSSFYVSTENCIICKDSHPIHQCEKFLKSTPEERASLAKTHSLCYNCLRRGHQTSRCNSGNCKKCSKKHNTLLHFKKLSTSQPILNKETSQIPAIETPIVSTHFSENSSLPQVLLSTLIVHVKTNSGGTYPCRTLSDSGSQANFVTASLVKKLNLKQTRQRVSVHGIGSSGTTQSCGIIKMQIQSIATSFSTDITAVVLPRITSMLPTKPVDPRNWKHLENIKLADPDYFKPGPIDLLLGAEVTTRVLRYGKIMGDVNQPSAQNTEFGWIVSGNCNSEGSSVVSHLSVTFSEDDQLKRFWEIEDIKSINMYSLDDKRCEAIYSSTTKRDSSGRYIVKLPFQDEIEQLGESRNQALFRFKQIEKKLSRQPELKKQYIQFMNEYLYLGHMEPILENSNISDSQVFYLPHHCVIREESSSTKLRVVFDASAISSSGISLNDRLMTGPTVQQELMSILLRFRKHRVVFTADITKMFRQIKVHPKHQDFQRILWRNSTEKPIQEFKLNTVTYGTKSAPFLATRTLNQLAADEVLNFSLASKVLTEDFYIDDCMTGANSLKEVLTLQEQLIALLNCGGFQLHKWASNSPEVLLNISEELQEKKRSLENEFSDGAIKTLGIGWIPDSDSFYFHITLSSYEQYSKRNVLSDIARLFDPLGWISPVVIIAKLLLQKLWLIGLAWDDVLPEDIATKWKDFKSQLVKLQLLRIPRFLETEEESTVELHGFECLTVLKNDSELIYQYSTLSKLVRVTAYVIRFIYNCKTKHKNRKLGFLSSEELEESLLLWVKTAQYECFASEINSLTKQQQLSNGSHFKSLVPFLDNCGLLRVGGWLDNSNLTFNKKHPLLLPRKHKLTELIVTHEHLKLLHGGQTLLLASLRERFWIVNAISVVRKIIHKCIKCFRQQKIVNTQLMGQLPSHRVQQSRPFTYCGVDYAGPLTIRSTTGRGRVRKEKCYVALFICFSTKAIHIELVTDLSTEAFVAALRRFVARRGKCSDIYSDCGTNFVGANRELKELVALAKSEKHNEQTGAFLASENIKWHFNPPSAPHFIGLWEAAVESAKYHLRRVVGNAALTFEQLYTVLTQVEACLNSRPLCQMPSDPNDLNVLTPGHFLIGDSLVSVPDRNVSELKCNSLSKWQFLQKLVQDFWRRWTSDLTTLQQRPRWTIQKRDHQPGNLVLLKDQLLQPAYWKLARVLSTHSGKDNLVRAVTIKTSSGIFKRPVSKLCALPE